MGARAVCGRVLIRNRSASHITPFGGHTDERISLTGFCHRLNQSLLVWCDAPSCRKRRPRPRDEQTPGIHVGARAVCGRILEPVCKIRKQEKRGNCDHGREIGGSFLIASGNASELLQAIDQAFNNIALAIVQCFKRTSSTFVAPASNGTTDILLMKIPAKDLTGVAFVCNQTLWTQAQVT